MSVVFAGGRSSRRDSCGLVLLIAASLFSVACGTNTKMTTPPPTTPTTPSQPSYPSTPPVPITWSPSTSLLPAPTATPPPAGSNDFPLTITSPTAGQSVTSPFNVVATASPTNPIFFMRVYVDQVSVYYTASNSLNTQIFASPGAHTVEVMAEDTTGTMGSISAIPINVTVTSQSQATISGIQNLSGWQSCSADFPANSQRAGQLCAAGNKNVPSSTMTAAIATPSMDGKSAQFTMSAPGGTPNPAYQYSNYLYFNAMAGGNSVSNFTYDLYFWVDHPEFPQALEFDVNQGYDDTSQGSGGSPIRYVWGSECNLRGDTPAGQWDIWNDSVGVWVSTGIPCRANQEVLGNTWNHLTWNLHRMGDMVFYDTLTLNGVVTQVNQSYINQSGWTLEEIDTAFQMDLDYEADPFNVWLDEVSLTAN